MQVTLVVKIDILLVFFSLMMFSFSVKVLYLIVCWSCVRFVF